MKKVLFIMMIMIIAADVETTAQNYLGRHKDDIVSLMRQDHRNFKLNKDAINRSYNYLKYEDKIAEQTILFFLSDKDYCTLVRMMSDYANINEVVNMLNTKYTKTDKNTWTYSEKGKQYIIRLEEGEWFFTVSFKQKI